MDHPHQGPADVSDSLQSYLATRPARADGRPPLPVILFEDAVEVASTLDHALRAGFRTVLALSPEPLALEIPANGCDR